ncbi:MAG: hypothetical protein JNJ99_06725 [Crocinitomicaceae bacterium]|nr:hypothetical protein [Crocinitomicaceae bacterium]
MPATAQKRKCIQCKDSFEGRIDKIFCSDYCKSAFHYEKNKAKEKSRFKIVDEHLKTNRRILSRFNKAGKAVVRKEDLEKEGFNPNFFTNYWKNQKGDVYLFCFEFGFLKKTENGKTKYVLVKWQDYMKK